MSNISEWQNLKLEQIADIIDSMHQTPKYSASGKPIVRVTDLNNSFIKLDECFKVKDEIFEIYSKKHKSQVGDIVFARVGSYGSLGFVNKEMDFCLGQNTAFIVPNKCEPKFLYYFLKSPLGNYEIESSVGGSTQPTISIKSIKNFDIVMPPLPEQQAIASVLSSLDDKIDLLHRQNKTLEAMAETLFRQWFIEEAKDDWEEILVSDLFEVRDGTHDSPKQSEVGFHLITSKHIHNGQIDFGSAYLVSSIDYEKINQRSKVEQFDILFSMIGTLGLIYIEMNEEVNYAIKNIGIFKTSQNPKWCYFVYLWLKSSFGNEFIEENKSGSTQEYISLGSLRKINFKVPNVEEIDSFNSAVDKQFNKIHANNKQIQTLENLRDTLLPKLMSSEIRVHH